MFLGSIWESSTSLFMDYDYIVIQLSTRNSHLRYKISSEYLNVCEWVGEGVYILCYKRSFILKLAWMSVKM